MNEGLFDSDFLSDAEVEEMIDLLVSTIVSSEIINDQQASVIDPFRIKQVAYVYKVMKYMTRGQNVNVEYQLHKPFKSMGYVRLTGKSVSFSNYEWFLKAAKLASNVEAVSKTDGTFEMNFGFHGLVRKI